jgi:hypothetical protein
VFSTLRQMMLDAQRYRDSMQIYERNRAARASRTDRSLAALIPVIEGRMPVVMLANSEREITRALDLATEFKLKLIIAGGREADRVADRLAKQNVPVLLSLNLPRRTTAAMPEADPSRCVFARARRSTANGGQARESGRSLCVSIGFDDEHFGLMVNANRRSRTVFSRSMRCVRSRSGRLRFSVFRISSDRSKPGRSRT